MIEKGMPMTGFFGASLAAVFCLAWGSGEAMPQTERQAGEERVDNGLKMKLCWCPPGSFQVGSLPTEPGRGNDEGPVQVRLLRGFWLER